MKWILGSLNALLLSAILLVQPGSATTAEALRDCCKFSTEGEIFCCVDCCWFTSNCSSTQDCYEIDT